MKSDSPFTGLKVAVVAAGSASGETGGAERLYTGLRDALAAEGCNAELITVPSDESSFQHILDTYERCRELDLGAFDLVISTKTPTYAIRHHRHVSWLVHTVRVFYDMFEEAFPSPTNELLRQRERIHRLDTEALGQAKHRFSIGHEVSARLRKWNGLDAEVLHPPLGSNRFREGEFGDYFFLPGRLHRWKRVDLAISAVKASRLPLRLLIAGTGEAEPDLRRLAGDDPRIEFLGRISDDALVEHYANCLAVPFMPMREDYGYVTLEAFSSGKPVITCRDSGEPTRFVAHRRNGLICESAPEEIREALEFLYTHREEARAMGARGAASIRHITWPAVARRLLEAGMSSAEPAGISVAVADRQIKVAVLDMQPIDPPIGGGRLRLLGLYHALGAGISARYVGTYDWPGEPFRRHRLTASLEEIDVPLSAEHHAAAQQLAREAGGKVVIDVAFPRLAHLSPDFINAAREAIEWADIVVFSHPWVYPLVADLPKSSQLVVYDSQNVEGFLRAQLLDRKNPLERALLREVVEAEYQVGTRADLVLGCSAEDLAMFQRVYDWPYDKMRVIPNGVMTQTITPPDADARLAARRALELNPEAFVAIFIGSAYGPNVDAASFITGELAPRLPDVVFVIAGGVGNALPPSGRDNVRITGFLDEPTKLLWLRASDIALNPMFSGSGTNIKMFDYMAAGLPVVSTKAGARGIEQAGQKSFLVVESKPQAFLSKITELRGSGLCREMGKASRACVQEGYAWERLSELAGTLFSWRLRRVGLPKPKFSVVIPTYARHDQLETLVLRLQQQVERDFEVVIVDQSAKPWSKACQDFGFPCLYYHTPVKGAVRARNTGAALAQGQVIAFTDDDCQPAPTWLLNAKAYFAHDKVVGVEGMITSDHVGEEDWRPVTNVGFEGLGFMTANLMVRAEQFHHLGGFDVAFDRPHFREDTDLGWRLQALGAVPYARDVAVHHPAQRRDIDRESQTARAVFFQKDALLYQKHPEQYRQLFMIEGHYRGTPGFAENFSKGFEALGISVPDWARSLISNRPVGSSGPGNQLREKCTAGKETIEDATMNDLSIYQRLLEEALFSLPPPPRYIVDRLPSVKEVLAQVRAQVGDRTHGGYFDSSTSRYLHYYSMAAPLPAGARVLDIGNAPGHAAIGLYCMGFDVQGLNLNDAWRSTYPRPEWISRFRVLECDIEREALPFPDGTFDAVMFTEVLEHVAITDPAKILAEIVRVLKSGGRMIFSTPNVCNLSNVVALIKGQNIFWPNEIFYGSLDRHNREYTPDEVSKLLNNAGFANVEIFGMNCASNWRAGGSEIANLLVAKLGESSPLLRNTIMAVCIK